LPAQIPREQTDARARRRRGGQVRASPSIRIDPSCGMGAEEGAADFFVARAPQADKAEQLALANARSRPHPVS
jgi:hypothetical protein